MRSIDQPGAISRNAIGAEVEGITTAMVSLPKMRLAGRATAQILKELVGMVEPGVTPIDLNQRAEALCREMGAIPAFKGYHGFPASVCVSVNDEVVHAIPNSRPFAESDLIKIDFGVIVDGCYGDSAVTVLLDPCYNIATDLLQNTATALYTGLSVIRPGATIGDIGYAIASVADQSGFTVVKTLAGHGIGSNLHEDPAVPNFGERGTGAVLQAGMYLAIEPIFSLGKGELVLDLDRWTLRTRDAGISAHFEHTIVVTSDGMEILTQC